MATGSRATKRQIELEKLRVAGYWQGASSALGQPRCGNCVAVRPIPKLFGATRYDRQCSTHDAAVKTHGCCMVHERAPISQGVS